MSRNSFLAPVYQGAFRSRCLVFQTCCNIRGDEKLRQEIFKVYFVSQSRFKRRGGCKAGEGRQLCADFNCRAAGFSTAERAPAGFSLAVRFPIVADVLQASSIAPRWRRAQTVGINQDKPHGSKERVLFWGGRKKSPALLLRRSALCPTTALTRSRLLFHNGRGDKHLGESTASS